MTENVLEWENLFYEKLNSDKNLNCKFARTVDGLSGKAVSGQLTAIMGSSGAGKTNLFELLVGNIATSSKTSGKILYNGVERKLEEWIKKISYLEQDDVYFPELTIHESMFYSLKLIYPDLKHSVIDDIIDKSLGDAEILNKKNALIDSLSGGERKRAMLALKLIGSPEVFILDEPTTGLDSHNALCVVNNLKKVAKERNVIVIMTVHQPGEALFNLFDKLIYITKQGTLYEGPIDEVESFLKSHGIIKMDKISISEFLFELFSENPYPYEIKDLQPQAEEIVRKNREKTKEARLYLDLKAANNSYVNLSEVRFSHMCTLIKRRIYLITRSPYVFLWFVFSFFFSALGILFCRNIYYGKFDSSDHSEKDSFDFTNLSFLRSIRTVLLILNLLGREVLLYVLLFTFKFSFNLDVCKQEIFTGKYSVSTYFATMILFELISAFFSSLFFIVPVIYLFWNMKFVLSILIIDTGYILVSYLSFLPLFSCISNNYKVFSVTYLLHFISSSKPASLKELCSQGTEFWKGLKYVFYLFNFLPLFLFNIIADYSYWKLVDKSDHNGSSLTSSDSEKHIVAEEFLKSCDFLGYVFSPIYVCIWGIILLAFFIYISFILIKWRISSNIRLKLN